MRLRRNLIDIESGPSTVAVENIEIVSIDLLICD